MSPVPEGDTLIRAGFLLTGSRLEPEEITAELGLVPTLIWREGQPRLVGLLPRHDSSGWAIRTDYESTLDLESHVRRILDIVHPHTEEIRRICDERHLMAGLECVVRIIGGKVQDVPVIFFQRQTIRLLADLDVDLDIDINLLAP